MKNIIACLIIWIIVPGNDKGYAQTQKADLNKFFIKKMGQAHIAGMETAFIKDEKLQWERSYGLKNYKTKEPVNDSTLFLIASCSKPVTALGLLKLYDRELIGLDENINDHLPFKISNPNSPDGIITLRKLLSHTSPP